MFVDCLTDILNQNQKLLLAMIPTILALGITVNYQSGSLFSVYAQDQSSDGDLEFVDPDVSANFTLSNQTMPPNASSSIEDLPASDITEDDAIVADDATQDEDSTSAVEESTITEDNAQVENDTSAVEDATQDRR